MIPKYRCHELVDPEKVAFRFFRIASAGRREAGCGEIGSRAACCESGVGYRPSKDCSPSTSRMQISERYFFRIDLLSRWLATTDPNTCSRLSNRCWPSGITRNFWRTAIGRSSVLPESWKAKSIQDKSPRASVPERKNAAKTSFSWICAQSCIGSSAPI